MSRFTKARVTVFFFAIAVTGFLGGKAQAQVSSTTGSATTAWGNYSWQLDQAPVTTTITAIAGFNTPPGLVQIPVSLPAGTTIHEVHGNFSLATWSAWDGSSGSCGNGSIIAQLRDQNGNAIAAVKLNVLGTGTTNIPITGTFTTPLSVTSLQIQYFVDLCGAQTVSFTLVMS
jgi:hypothetical protein